MTNRIEKGILVIFFVDNLHGLIYHQQDSVNLIPETWFYSKLKFSLEMSKRLR